MAEPQAIENGNLSKEEDIDLLADWLNVPENIATGGFNYNEVQQRYNAIAQPQGLPAWRTRADIQQINPTEGMGFFGKMRESFTGTARETAAMKALLITRICLK